MRQKVSNVLQFSAKAVILHSVRDNRQFFHTSFFMNHNTYCATIGFFDGVHRGHQFVIARLRNMACEAGMQSMVITFDRHPRQTVDAAYAPRLITPHDEKLRLLKATGIDRIEVLAFDKAMAAMSARDFMRCVLRDRLGVARLLIGYDNRFGHNRAEGFDDYVCYGRELGIEVVQNTPTDVDGMRVSSSLVRRLLAHGDVDGAAVCLGRPYALEGIVQHGYEEGRKMGFPTANILPDCDMQIVPRGGVYATRLSAEGGQWMASVTNIGSNPTFGRTRQTIESHVICFDGNLYGRRVRLEFCRRLRDERKFDSVDELRRQIERDCAEAEALQHKAAECFAPYNPLVALTKTDNT